MELTKQSGRIHVMFGYSGSGKSTISKAILALSQRYVYISTSDIVHELGGHDDEAIKKGELFSGEEELRARLADKLNDALLSHEDIHILLDGFPRTSEQWEWLLNNYCVDLGVFVYLHTSVGMLRHRLSSRGRDDIKGYEEEAVVKKRLAREMAEYPKLWKEICESHPVYAVNNDLRLDLVVGMVKDVLDGDIAKVEVVD